ncbi:glycerophosphodiester phosphodiesterase family protein [Fulvivirgaceae bacterium BMA12]|uniref:Glycerophosphodiester phosphodiesterase family protein n=1 Tax=Agaribacillus aureus TaxID=3051825 RepID=A0ABT8LHB9_9BACT|nr:glycerophosphodiester phosphodiesterase family protein [Fulvivirgaceae bacterium BMA12]
MFMKIGHRGAMGHAPENTLLSFSTALKMKVDMIELDVTLCQSGEAVVIHDDRLERTTDGNGYVKDHNLEDLKRLNAGKGEQIPTLVESLNFINRKVPTNIELKNGAVVPAVIKIVNQLVKEQGWSLDDFLISSFDHHALKAFKTHIPDIRIGVLLGIIPLDYAAMAKHLNAYAINPCIDFINQAFVEDAKMKGLKTFVWTVNYAEDIKRMQLLGVDGIFTNYPDRL